MAKLFSSLLILMAILLIGGCAPKPSANGPDVEGLANAIQALGPNVDPAEAQRAANIAYSHSLRLKQEYRVTDSAIVHNAKVVNGFRERGLCNHWAEDMLKRLRQENFRTLDLHWATSPPTTFRIIHHSALISAKGDSMYEGIILDPWRYSGALFWAPTKADDRYNWRPRMEVREELLNGELPG